MARFRENRARNSGNWAQMKDDTGVVGATQGKGRIPWDPPARKGEKYCGSQGGGGGTPWC